jgi:hypothetical protein
MKKLLFLVLVTIFSGVQMNAQQKQVFTKNNIAVNGYDVVAYFTESKPVKGNDEHTISWNDANWLFATYGGYCAFGCSRGYKAKTEPDAWSIVNGKLYLNYNLQVRDTWSRNANEYIKKADTAWQSIQHADIK